MGLQVERSNLTGNAALLGSGGAFSISLTDGASVQVCGVGLIPGCDWVSGLRKLLEAMLCANGHGSGDHACLVRHGGRVSSWDLLSLVYLWCPCQGPP